MDDLLLRAIRPVALVPLKGASPQNLSGVFADGGGVHLTFGCVLFGDVSESWIVSIARGIDGGSWRIAPDINDLEPEGVIEAPELATEERVAEWTALAVDGRDYLLELLANDERVKRKRRESSDRAISEIVELRTFYEDRHRPFGLCRPGGSDDGETSLLWTEEINREISDRSVSIRGRFEVSVWVRLLTLLILDS